GLAWEFHIFTCETSRPVLCPRNFFALFRRPHGLPRFTLRCLAEDSLRRARETPIPVLWSIAHRGRVLRQATKRRRARFPRSPAHRAATPGSAAPKRPRPCGPFPGGRSRPRRRRNRQDADATACPIRPCRAP